MLPNRPQDHSLITIYNDSTDEFIARSIKSVSLNRDVLIVTPKDEKTLIQAAMNSSLVFIGINKDNDPSLKLGSVLLEHRLIAADIVAFYLDSLTLSPIQIMSKGFSCCVERSITDIPEYKNYLMQKISSGNRRLSSIIQEEEYRRMSDALSCAPASMIIFDQNKRAVFVSDHYYRAYPKIATRLIRGLSVYDAFDLMMKEEAIPDDDPRHKHLQKFWHNLEGRIEFKLDSGTIYSIKAVNLPNNRGTVVVGQNVTMYRNNDDDFHSSNIANEENVDNILHQIVSDLYDPLQSLMTSMADLQHDMENQHKLKRGLKDARSHLEQLEQLYEKIENVVEEKK